MCQNVKRRLVVRSNDDGRRSTTIFSENVAVTEISKQIIEVWSFCDWEIWWKKKQKQKQNNDKKKTKQQQQQQWSFPGWILFLRIREKIYKFNLVLILKFKGF